MIHMIEKDGDSALIAGVLVVVAVVALWGLAWLAFNTSPVWVLVAVWAGTALLPFAFRLASIWLLPTRTIRSGRARSGSTSDR